jgi:hypothetical protein
MLRPLFSLSVAILSVSLLTPGSALAERPIDPSFEISAMGGYGWGGKIKLDVLDQIDGKLKIDPGPIASGMIGLRLRSDEGKLIVFSYHRQFSSITLKIPSSSTSPGGGVTKIQSGDFHTGYVQVGGELDGKVGRARPFFGATLGATHFTPLDSGFGTEWFFSAGFYGGVKIPIGKHFGIRMQGRMMGTVLFADSDLFCTGNSCLVSIDEVTGPIQGDLSGGFYVAF